MIKKTYFDPDEWNAIYETHEIVRAFLRKDMENLRNDGPVMVKYAAMFNRIYPLVHALHAEVTQE